MKNKKIFVIALFLILLILTGCNKKNLPENHTLAAKNGYPKELIGTWEATWENEFYEILVIQEDGYYKSNMYKNGVLIAEEYNVWYMPNSVSLVCAIGNNLGDGYVRRYEDGNLYLGYKEDGTVYKKKYN